MVDNDPQFNASAALLKPQKYIDLIINGKSKSIYDIYEKPPRIAGAKKKPSGDPGDYIIQAWHMVPEPDIRLDLIASRIELYETLRSPAHKEYLLDEWH